MINFKDAVLAEYPDAIAKRHWFEWYIYDGEVKLWAWGSNSEEEAWQSVYQCLVEPVIIRREKRRNEFKLEVAKSAIPYLIAGGFSKVGSETLEVFMNEYGFGHFEADKALAKVAFDHAEAMTKEAIKRGLIK